MSQEKTPTPPAAGCGGDPAAQATTECQKKIKGTPAPIDPTKNSIICKNGKLVVQNNNSGPDKSCTDAHESSHIRDWKDRYGEDLCNGVADGSLPVGGEGYDEFLRKSECTAYAVGKACRQELLKTANKADQPAIQGAIDRDDAQLKGYGCS
ncbi:MAG TPA: hypothetical protein VF173_23295 [Thermoanaerobaculia bacterium]|nr:hypothetical protein [Thermoanaerobaculia bacterium]